MSQSFTLDPDRYQPDHQSRKRVLVTGAGGNIGRYFVENAHERYQLRLLVHHSGEQREFQQYGEAVSGDLADLSDLKALCQGIDTVVHLAGDANPSATWEALLNANIIGTYNVFVAAKAARCRRVIYASSIHAVSGYPVDVQVKSADPVNPGDLYGVSKCFGEALGRYMAEKEDLSVIALRIGAFQPRNKAREEGSLRMLDAFVSRRDLTQLIMRCIEDTHLRFAIFHGLSNNRFKRLDISDARELVGYAPQDDSTEENPKAKELHLSEQVAAHSMADGSQRSGLRNEL